MKFDAVVFGLYETGLGVARSLGSNGLKVVGIDHKKDIGWYSRYINPLKCPHPIIQEDDFLKWILTTFSRNKEKKIPVFFTSDDFLIAFSKNRKIFDDFFIYNLISHSFLNKIADKYQQALIAERAGIEIPKTYALTSVDDIAMIPSDINYPLFIKGRDVNVWRKKVSGSVKGFQVKNRIELQTTVSTLTSKNIPVIIQEVILGADKNHFKYSVYVSVSGKTLGEFTLQKIRQNPPHFGVGSVVESNYFPELIEIGRKLFKNIGYTGIGSAEFKKDDRDGNLKLIEINPRYWQQNYLATYCGVNFPYINYLDLMGFYFEAKNNYKTGVKWINRQLDFDSFLKYRKEKQLTFWGWRKSLQGKKIISDFFWDDPLPALYNIEFGMKLITAPYHLIKRFI